jgi:hypothetical protein
MDENPKSIWKKPLRLPQMFLAWLGLMVATMLIFVIVMLAINQPFTKFHEFFGLFVFGAVSASILLAAWIFIRWLCCWRNFKRFFFGIACFATLIALFYAEEDWRGKHDLEKYKREWEAKGEKFDFKDFVPSPVPDDQNFAMAPIWVESIEAGYGSNVTWQWYGKKLTAPEQAKLVDHLQMPLAKNDSDWPTNSRGSWQKATLTDLKPWQNYYRALAAKTNLFPVALQPQSPAADVLLALSKYDSTIEELREASKLPDSRFPLEYDKADPGAILLPHLAVLKRVTQTLQLRAIAELRNGQSEKALDDVKLMLYLNQSIRTEPILISHLVRIAMMEITLQPIYEGLAEHAWSDVQLAELDSELAKLDFLADYKFSMRGERAFGISITEYLRRSRNFQALDYDESDNHSNPASHLGFRLAPAWFFYRNELNIARMHQQWTLPMVDMENRVVSPDTVRRNDAAGEKELKHGWPYNILARMIFPAFENAVKKYAREQSSLDLARVAIALERYRLAHGQYPGSLDALAPQFMEKIPHDIINGQPLKYRREANGQFILYSIGWNEADDGGVVVFKKGSSSEVDILQGDWVWRYPAK